jgi:hypothetical protein
MSARRLRRLVSLSAVGLAADGEKFDWLKKRFMRE